MKKYGIILLLAILLPTAIEAQDEKVYTLPSAQPVYEPTYRNDGINAPVKNVILMVGDGMGLAHMASALYANRGDLAIARLHHIGLVRTQSGNRYITDSAAAGTAYATGRKTDNNCIGTAGDGDTLENMTEILAARGYATGIVTTDKISGATPAAFYAHQPKRSMTAEILTDLADTRADFVAGSSVSLFESVGGGKLDSLRAHGFTVVHDFHELPTLAADKIALIACDRDAEQVQNGRDSDYLRAVSEFAMKFLADKSDKGFFLLIEGAEIDHAAHGNDLEGVVRETLDFDKAVAEALRFADSNGETLVVILADHETGGLALGDGDVSEGRVSGRFTSTGHSPVPVPVYAYGPHADDFCGVLENTEIFFRIRAALQHGR